MRQQAFLDGIRSSRGMGMADTRMRDNRSADQDQTQSGNPRTIFNQPRMSGLARGNGVPNGFGTPAGYENPASKVPPQSFHQRAVMPNRGVRPQFGQLQGGAPAQQQQMPPQTQQQLMLQQQQLMQQQQQPVDPRMRFARPMFRQ